MKCMFLTGNMAYLPSKLRSVERVVGADDLAQLSLATARDEQHEQQQRGRTEVRPSTSKKCIPSPVYRVMYAATVQRCFGSASIRLGDTPVVDFRTYSTRGSLNIVLYIRKERDTVQQINDQPSHLYGDRGGRYCSAS